ncbi:MAG TPA: DUF1003 domain-containing protein [Gaiellaceae bacterium]|nr:DUF1003 domain-containing protein [Gaiellaceae bacterium]
MATRDPLRHLTQHEHLRGAFGNDAFGRIAERCARFFGTPQYIVGQSAIVVAWVIVNAIAWSLRWDPYPFILLNLAFSTQAAYAAPLILLAQTRQAARDQLHAESSARHAQELAERQERLLEENTRLTQEVHRLSAEIHARIVDAA